jgi:hypothetical protein
MRHCKVLQRFWFASIVVLQRQIAECIGHVNDLNAVSANAQSITVCGN